VNGISEKRRIEKMKNKSEFEKEIQIPMSERVRLEALKFDGCNPNRLSREGIERLKASIRKWGDIVPIVTNKDLLVADGEQRALAMKELGMTECSVIRLPVEDVDRRLLRQMLNKLRGEHVKELDAEEFRIIVEAGAEEDLKYLLGLSDEKLQTYFNGNIEEVEYYETFEVVVSCKDEAEQETVYNKLRRDGYKCRVLTL
jgi:ParB-like chromosome segregation protein Spo0J